MRNVLLAALGLGLAYVAYTGVSGDKGKAPPVPIPNVKPLDPNCPDGKCRPRLPWRKPKAGDVGCPCPCDPCPCPDCPCLKGVEAKGS